MARIKRFFGFRRLEHPARKAAGHPVPLDVIRMWHPMAPMLYR